MRPVERDTILTMTEAGADRAEQNRAEWKDDYAATEYGAREKAKLLGPYFQKLASEGKIGGVVVDVGSGNFPLSQNIPGEHKLITVDYGGRATMASLRSARRETVHVPYNIETTARAGSFDNRKALVKVAQFLGNDQKNPTEGPCADTMVCSEVLNYVDYASVLSGYQQYLKPGGRFIILNEPGWGEEQRFSEKGVKNNTELRDFLTANGFEIELAKFPWNLGAEDTWSDNGRAFIVARKKAGGE